MTTHRHLFNFIAALCSAARQISLESVLINNTVCSDCLIRKHISKWDSGVDFQVFTTSALFWKEGSDRSFREHTTEHEYKSNSMCTEPQKGRENNPEQMCQSLVFKRKEPKDKRGPKYPMQDFVILLTFTPGVASYIGQRFFFFWKPNKEVR